jgi:5-methylcytosine-specific restriction enzyme A
MPTINLGRKKPRDRTVNIQNRQDIYQNKRWRKIRDAKLKNDPLCEDCLKEDRVTQTQEVHHHIPIDVNPDLAFEYDNLVSLCIEHHKLRHRK